MVGMTWVATEDRRFRSRLALELDERRLKNPRYSLRAFAAFLETDHSTLSQILDRRRRVPLERIRDWARKLNLDREETAAYIAAEHVPDDATARRNEQLRHWTEEALAIVTGSLHWQILELSRTPEFQNHSHPYDSRLLAARTGASVDQVNIACTRLLRLRLLGFTGTEKQFRKLALARIREQAAGRETPWQNP